MSKSYKETLDDNSDDNDYYKIIPWIDSSKSIDQKKIIQNIRVDIFRIPQMFFANVRWQKVVEMAHSAPPTP